MKNQNGFKMDMSEFKGSVIAQLTDIKSDIGSMNTKLDTYIYNTDKRISVLETFKIDLMAKMTVVIAVLTIALNLGWDFIKARFGVK